MAEDPGNAGRRGVPRWGGRELIRNLTLLTLPTLLLLAVVLEVALRTLVPACEAPSAYLEEAYGVLRYDAEEMPEGVYTRGALARQRAHWRINEAGWNSLVEYETADARSLPLVAVIGDSYVAGMSVDVEDHLATRLRDLLGPAAEVYAFGTPGAPLSQYLQMSRYVAARFDPQVLVFVVVHNDFDQSLERFYSHPHFLQLRRVDGTWVERPPGPYRPSRLVRLLKHSALVRWLYLNAGLANALARTGDPNRVEPLGLDDAERDRISDGIAWIADRIRAENPDRELYFVVDAPRADIYAGRLEHSQALWMNRLMASEAARIGAECIDLTGRFAELHAASGERFDFARDYHWNARGHAVAANALYQRLRDASAVLGPILRGRGAGSPALDSRAPTGAQRQGASGGERAGARDRSDARFPELDRGTYTPQRSTR